MFTCSFNFIWDKQLFLSYYRFPSNNALNQSRRFLTAKHVVLTRLCKHLSQLQTPGRWFESHVVDQLFLEYWKLATTCRMLLATVYCTIIYLLGILLRHLSSS